MKQTLKYIYQNILEKNKIAEGKFSITIALASAVVVLGASFVTQHNITVNLLAGANMLFALISIIYAFFALIARKVVIRQRKITIHYTNLMYYKTIIKFDEYSYLSEIKKRYNFPSQYKFDEFDLDLAREIIATAKVVNSKFLYFNLSLVFLLLSILFTVGIVIFARGLQ